MAQTTQPPAPAPATPGAVALQDRLARLICTVLRVPVDPSDRGTDKAHRLFSTSILLSATRCLLSYVVFPIFAPALGAASGVGPAITIPVGIVALVFDVRAVRRFWWVDHQYKWWITAIYAVVMVMVSALLVADVVHVLT